jgi:uncharacterized protein (TIGR02246 family)
MNSPRRLAIAVVIFAAITACAKTAAPDTAADEAAIRDAQHAWYKAFNSGDAAAVAALYSDDAVVAAPHAPAAKGNAAIRDFVAKTVDTFRSSALAVAEGPTSDVGVSGDLAWQADTYTVTDKSGATVEAGKTLTVFQRKDGKWLMIRDTWNSDAPPATEASK